MTVCPVCSEKIVLPSGDPESEILIISSVPSEEEINFGKPIVGFNSKIFRKEAYNIADLDLQSCRFVYLWFHEKSSTKKGKMCFNVSIECMEKELEIERKYIILVGADAVKYFTGLSVDDVNGMDITSEIDHQNCENTKFFALCNPNSMFKTVGELRFGLEKLKLWLEE